METFYMLNFYLFKMKRPSAIVPAFTGRCSRVLAAQRRECRWPYNRDRRPGMA
jgi:hypothetical protein